MLPYVIHDSPIGRLSVHDLEGSVHRLEIESSGRLAVDDLPATASPPPATALLDEARRQLDGYFDRRLTRFDLPLSPIGTLFQLDIWEALAEVPWGESTTYGALAEASGRPTGARAVGGAIRANSIALIVPCHRVLGVDGRLTGYSPGEGVATKRRLLEHEGIAFRE